MKSVSISETRREIVGLLELERDRPSECRVRPEEGKIKVEFVFHVHPLMHNPEFFKNLPVVMERFGAKLCMTAVERQGQTPIIELSVEIVAGEVKP